MTHTHQDHRGSGLEHKQVHEGNKSGQNGIDPGYQYDRVNELNGERIEKMIQDLKKKRGF